jgi:AcrR family transcriptional regulator
MADLNTKQKIIKASIELFNQHGMCNVRLQQIADEIDISVGNLAYHFKNKEAIIYSINEELYKEAAGILSQYRVYPNFMDFDSQLLKYFQFIEKYPFYFIDLLEIKRHYPKIYRIRNSQINKMISQIRMRFEYHIQRGALMPEERKGMYESNIRAIWMTISHWLPQKAVQGQLNTPLLSQFKEMIWHQVYPHLSESGRAEYELLIIPILHSEYKP